MKTERPADAPTMPHGHRRSVRRLLPLPVALALAAWVGAGAGPRVKRDETWPTRGPWVNALPKELPTLYQELNGIDFGHAHLAETLLLSRDPGRVEEARLEVLEFISSLPAVPPDEEHVAPVFHRLAWEAQRAFDRAHALHRSLYDLFASDRVPDKEAAYRRILGKYLESRDAITPHRLDHHGKLWGFPESKSFRDRFPDFNSQIWVYHWLQAVVYDVQLLGGAVKQRELILPILERYHEYLRQPPLGWTFMPLMPEGGPEFSRRFPEAAAIFDNLHMLHDNMDDILSRPDLFPTLPARREAILEVLSIYLQRNHEPGERFGMYELPEGVSGHGANHAMRPGGVRPPSALEVLGGKPAEHHHGEPE